MRSMRGTARSHLGVGFAVVLAAGTTALAQPRIVPQRQGELGIVTAATGVGQITQFALGPDSRLYASSVDQGVLSFHYDPLSARLTDMRVASPIASLGIGFHASTRQMYVTTFGGSIVRMTDDNGDGLWGQGADLNVPIVRNVPVGDHQMMNLRIVGNALHVGVGARTMNGGTGRHTGGAIDDHGGTGMFAGGEGRTFGESAYNGTISWIRDLTAVPNTVNAAGLFSDTSMATIQGNATPHTSTDPGKLVVHSAGTRTPYGLAVDRDGQLFFTNNFNRADTNGDGTATRGLYADAPGPDLTRAVHDQTFRAVLGADYGYPSDNWRGRVPILTPGSPGYDRQRSITFDNLWSDHPNYLGPYDPRNPVGLGPSSSSNGIDFSYSDRLPEDLRGNAFIARFNPSITSSTNQTYTYSDLVAVNMSTGATRVVAEGFDRPLAVYTLPNGSLLVSDFGARTISYVYPTVLFHAPVPEPATVVLFLTAAPTLALAWTWRRSRTSAREPA